MGLMEEILKRLEYLHPKIIDLKLDRVKRLLRKHNEYITKIVALDTTFCNIFEKQYLVSN